jgi:cytochrome c551/c552
LNNQQAGALSREESLLDGKAIQADPKGCACCHQSNT